MRRAFVLKMFFSLIRGWGLPVLEMVAALISISSLDDY